MCFIAASVPDFRDFFTRNQVQLTAIKLTQPPWLKRRAKLEIRRSVLISTLEVASLRRQQALNDLYAR